MEMFFIRKKHINIFWFFSILTKDRIFCEFIFSNLGKTFINTEVEYFINAKILICRIIYLFYNSKIRKTF